MQCHVLGPVEVIDEAGDVVELGGVKQRALFALLVAAGGRVVSVERLIDELWGENASAKAVGSVHAYVANLRRVLEPDRRSRAAATRLVTRSPGYALVLPSGSVDADQFARLTASGRELMSRDPRRAVERLQLAQSLWRGDPYADVAGAAPGLVTEAVRLSELRLAAAEACWRARIAIGDHESVVGEIESHVVTHPLREQAWALLALALYRSQRQGDALSALRRARTVLSDELGVDPGLELRQLEESILAQDPSLDAARATPPSAEDDRTAGGASPALVTTQPGNVGRRDVIARLGNCVREAAAGHGRLLLVTGEPGIGKTTLARTMARLAEEMGLATGWGHCEEASGAPAMWPWSQALAGALEAKTLRVPGVSEEQLAAAAALLPRLRPARGASTADEPTRDPHATAFRLSEAVAALLREVAGPTLLVLDDAHWADGDTLELLRRLAPRLTELPVAILVTTRDADSDIGEHFADVLGDLARLNPHREPLAGLGLADVVAYLRDTHGVEAPEVARLLHARTDGNPFFLGELARMLAGDGRLSDPTSAPPGEVPHAVRDVVRRRLARLSPAVEELLRVAAVTGPSFDLEVVEAASALDPDTAASAIETAVRAGLLVDTRAGRCRFVHALIQEAVVQRVGPSRRLELHARIAQAIEQLWSGALEDRLAELALHYGQAGARHARTAWAYASRAAASAAAQPAPLEAARLLDAALTAQTRDPTATPRDRYELLVALMIARKRAGQEQSAWHTMRQAAQTALEAGDVVAAAQAAVTITADSIWNWREYLEVDHQVVALFEHLLTELSADQPVLRARLLATLATELYYLPEQAQRTLALSQDALDTVRAKGDAHDLARILELRHVVLERPPLLRQRLATSNELVSLARSSTDPVATARALIFRGRDQIESGNLDAGLADYAEARTLAERHALMPALVALAFTDAVVMIARGEFAGTDDAIARALELHRNTTLPGASQLPAVLAATLNMTRGTLATIEKDLEEAARRDASGLFREVHALALLRSGQPDAARTALGGWNHQPDIPGDFLWLARVTIRASLWSELAPPAVARALHDELAPYADRIAVAGTGIAILGFPGYALGRLARRSGDLDTAVTELTAALQRHQASGLRPFTAATAHELDITLRQRCRLGDQKAASTYASMAEREALSLGMTFPVL
jgi:DNA-binding SARP family transcriptional activator